MAAPFGLYYPFIHFPSDAWVKLGALYWARMARIVPSDYETHDSEVVKALASETDFIINVPPNGGAHEVFEAFATLLTEREAALRTRYSVDQADAWQPDPITRQRMG